MNDFLDLTLDGADLPKTSDDWYTPKWIFDALQLFFDLDVSAPVGGIPWLPSFRYLTIIDDGLSQSWGGGKVWMNPPYSDPTPWMIKFRANNNGIALVPTSTGKWFMEAWNDVNLEFLCLPPMKFVNCNMIEAKGALPTRCWLIAAGEENVLALQNSGLGKTR